ncbi:MAG: hypothetical protein JWP29_3552 [Rhodoferax sp.]|nr:hypothetical protein [Rhodoferax sp.]
MPTFTNTTTAPIHVGGVLIVPGQAATVDSREPLLKAKGFKALLDAGYLHEGEPTPEELADQEKQEAELAARMAADGKNPDGTPMTDKPKKS